MSKIIYFVVVAICLPFSIASYAASASELSMPFLFAKSDSGLNVYELKQYIFIGSFVLLMLNFLTKAWATISDTIAFIALYFLSAGLYVLSQGGVSIVSLFSDTTLAGEFEGAVLNVGSSIALVWFSISLFKLKLENALCYLILKRFSGLLLLTIPLSYFVSEQSLWFSHQLLTNVTLVSLIVLGHLLISSNNRLLTFFFITIVCQLLLNFTRYFLHFWAYSAEFINVIAMLGYWLMAVMVTYLLARKNYFQLQDQQVILQEALQSEQSSREAQQLLLEVQQEDQELLESRVQERTLELNITLQELEDVNQALQEKNTRDELSGLYNRRHYDQKILAEYRRSRRNLTPLSLVLIDIDHFKKVNDTYGHLIGDKCLVQAANIIKQLLRRSSDIACRYGGEEFCLILPETNSHGALALAEKIRLAICAKPIECDDRRINLTVSCGITTYLQEKAATPEDIFSCADSALYQAKHAGRNQVQIKSLCKV